MNIESECVDDTYVSNFICSTSAKVFATPFRMDISPLWYSFPELYLLLGRKHMGSGGGSEFPSNTLFCVPHHGDPFADEDLTNRFFSEKSISAWESTRPAQLRSAQSGSGRDDKSANKDLLALIAHQVEKSIYDQQKKLESKFRQQIREELIPQLRDELVLQIRKEIIRELETGELFGDAVEHGSEFLEWCSKHKSLLERYPNTNVAIDVNLDSIVLASSDEWDFVTQLKELEVKAGKEYRVLHTGAYAALTDANGI